MDGAWPWCLPPALATRGDFMELAATCRVLRDWCEDVDASMQTRAAHEPDALLRSRLEAAGWRVTELGAAAVHLAALCVAAASGLWARDAAERTARAAFIDARAAVFDYQRHLN